ncbi:MAG: peroxiredoxin (alkyl hydroperoxide reductase subunit C) [Candidatus Omnitrophota bacterium]|jgi:peroxiredoxin (alkyl hydroperoxide reductase subunit C)
MSIRVGTQLPDFKATAYFPDGEMKELNFADYKGKWSVVFFYPLDFTFVCPTEIQAYSKQAAEFSKEGAEIIAVSTDSAFTHKAWAESSLGKVDFPIIGDTNHEVSRLFGVLIEEKGIALRGTFIINPEGVLMSSVVNDLSVGRSVDETFRTLKAFQTGGLTPCEWKPGQETLKV